MVEGSLGRFSVLFLLSCSRSPTPNAVLDSSKSFWNAGIPSEVQFLV